MAGSSAPKRPRLPEVYPDEYIKGAIGISKNGTLVFAQRPVMPFCDAVKYDEHGTVHFYCRLCQSYLPFRYFAFQDIASAKRNKCLPCKQKQMRGKKTGGPLYASGLKRLLFKDNAGNVRISCSLCGRCSTNYRPSRSSGNRHICSDCHDHIDTRNVNRGDKYALPRTAGNARRRQGVCGICSMPSNTLPKNGICSGCKAGLPIIPMAHISGDIAMSAGLGGMNTNASSLIADFLFSS